MSRDAKALLESRWARVEQRVHAACQRSGRKRGDVTVVAVTKTVPVEVARLACDVGDHHLGESRPQELWRKAAEIDRAAFWHLVGHLQRNKVERTLPLAHLIHSVDSVRLLEAIDGEAGRQVRIIDVLLEVNASGEASKHGFAPEALPGLAEPIARLRNVRVRGLMTMAAYEEDPERCRPTFARLRELRDRLRRELGPGHALDQLSMGMSNDFEVAVEEGATLVRLGTVLFEGLAGGPS
jgi:pyridoxal phosphate enzyme (YggS family)